MKYILEAGTWGMLVTSYLGWMIYPSPVPFVRYLSWGFLLLGLIGACAVKLEIVERGGSTAGQANESKSS